MEQQIVEEVRRLRRTVRLMGAGLIGISGLFLAGATVVTSAQDGEDLRVRSLTIVDERGVERVVLGAPVPNPGQGQRIAPAYGIVLNGPDGEERGGYATNDTGEAFLTLDSRNGREVFKVVANPDAGASLFLLHSAGAAAALTTYRGTPEFHLIGPNGARVHTIPSDAPPIP